MPVTNKQKPPATTTKPTTPTSPSSNGEAGDGLKFLGYGRGKTGKTRFATTFPKKLLMIATEDGTRSICTSKTVEGELSTGTPVYVLKLGGKDLGIHYCRIQASAEVDELAQLALSGGYKSVVLDTAGGVQDIILKEILGLADVPVQKSWGMAQQKDWQVCGAQLKERLRTVLDLADRHGINVFCIAHERSFSDENNSDLIAPTVGAALTPTATAWLNGAVDYICQSFIREKVESVTSTIGGKATTTQRKTGKMEFCLRVGPHAVYMTGWRSPPGVEVPDVIVDPHFDKVIKYIRG